MKTPPRPTFPWVCTTSRAHRIRPQQPGAAVCGAMLSVQSKATDGPPRGLPQCQPCIDYVRDVLAAYAQAVALMAKLDAKLKKAPTPARVKAFRKHQRMTAAERRAAIEADRSSSTGDQPSRSVWTVGTAGLPTLGDGQR